MLPITVYCSRCWTGQTFIGAWRAKCPACDRVTRWLTASMLDRPKKPYELSRKDRALLFALWIDPEL